MKFRQSGDLLEENAKWQKRFTWVNLGEDEAIVTEVKKYLTLFNDRWNTLSAMRFDIPKSSKKSQWSKTMKMVKSFWHIASLISLILFSPSWLEAACNTSDMRTVDTSHILNLLA